MPAFAGPLASERIHEAAVPIGKLFTGQTYACRTKLDRHTHVCSPAGLCGPELCPRSSPYPAAWPPQKPPQECFHTPPLWPYPACSPMPACTVRCTLVYPGIRDERLMRDLRLPVQRVSFIQSCIAEQHIMARACSRQRMLAEFV